MKKIIPLILFFSLIGIACIIRLAFPFGSFSFDEVFSITFAQHSLPNMWRLSQIETNPPLYYILLHFWINIFGVTEIAVRMLSIIGGVCTVAGVYALGKQLFSRSTGYMASVIFAFSPFAIFFSREARMYPLLTAAFAWAMYYCWKYLRSHKSRDAAVYIILLIIASLLHFGAWIAIAAHFIIVLFFVKKHFSISPIKWFILHVPLGIVIAGTLLRVLLSRSSGDTSFLNHWAFYFSEFKFFPIEAFSAGLLTSVASSYIVIIWLFALFFLACLFSVLKKLIGILLNRPLKYAVEIYWLLLLLFVPILIGYAAHLQAIRFFVAPLLLLPIFFGVIAGWLSRFTRAMFTSFLIALCLLMLPTSISLAEPIQWKLLTKHVDQRIKPGDLVLIHLFHESLTYNWYAKQSHAVGFFPFNSTFTFEDVIRYNPSANITTENVGKLQEYTRDYSRVFLVSTHGEDTNFWRGDLVRTWFYQHGWTEVDNKTFSPGLVGIGTVRVFERK